MRPAAHTVSHTNEPTPFLAHVVEAWAIVATLAPALLAKFLLF